MQNETHINTFFSLARKFVYTILCLFGCIVYGADASTESFTYTQLSDIAYFHKCYRHITGKRAPKDHSLLVKIKTNVLTGEAACLQLFDSVQLKTNGFYNNANTETTNDSISSINHLNHQDRKKFQVEDYFNSLPDSGQYADGQFDIYDSTVPSLALTEALLNPQRQFKDIFTMNRSPRAEREKDPSSIWPQYSAYMIRTFYGGNTQIKNAMKNSAEAIVASLLFPDFTVNTTNYKQNIIQTSAPADAISGIKNSLNPSFNITSYVSPEQRIKIGTIKGITYDSTFTSRFPANSQADQLIKTQTYFIQPFDIRSTIDQSFENSSSLGGGIGLTREYLMLNFGWGFDFAADGSVKMPRRWSKSFVKDFLCRELPGIRSSDANQFVVSSPRYTEEQVANTAPFRTAVSCTGCHATMDQLSGVLRNITWLNSGLTNDNNAPGATVNLVNRKLSSTANTDQYPNEAWLVNTYPSTAIPYHEREPVGNFLYRSYNGNLYNIPLTGPRDFAQKMTEVDDIYVCAAKNYFKQLTGIDVSLHDIGDPGSSSINMGMSEINWEHRDFVIQLGMKLKTSQNAGLIFKDILKSKYFRSIRTVKVGAN